MIPPKKAVFFKKPGFAPAPLCKYLSQKPGEPFKQLPDMFNLCQVPSGGSLSMKLLFKPAPRIVYIFGVERRRFGRFSADAQIERIGFRAESVFRRCLFNSQAFPDSPFFTAEPPIVYRKTVIGQKFSEPFGLCHRLEDEGPPVPGNTAARQNVCNCLAAHSGNYHGVGLMRPQNIKPVSKPEIRTVRKPCSGKIPPCFFKRRRAYVGADCV